MRNPVNTLLIVLLVCNTMLTWSLFTWWHTSGHHHVKNIKELLAMYTNISKAQRIRRMIDNERRKQNTPCTNEPLIKDGAYNINHPQVRPLFTQFKQMLGVSSMKQSDWRQFNREVEKYFSTKK